MSRTYKDRPPALRFPEDQWEFGRYRIAPGCYLYKKGVKTKKRKSQFTEWRWLQSTPSWWTRMTMNRPLRRRGKHYEHSALRIIDLEDLMPFNNSHKPHQYYW